MCKVEKCKGEFHVTACTRYGFNVIFNYGYIEVALVKTCGGYVARRYREAGKK